METQDLGIRNNLLMVYIVLLKQTLLSHDFPVVMDDLNGHSFSNRLGLCRKFDSMGIGEHTGFELACIQNRLCVIS